MANPALIYGAGLAVNQIGQFLSANSAAKRRQKQIDDEIARRKKTLGTKFLDVNRIDSAEKRAIIEQSSKSGNRLDRALNIDVGGSQGGIAENLAGQVASSRASNIRTDEIGRANRDAQTEDDIARLKGLDVGKPSTGNLLAGLASTGLNTYGNVSAQNQATEQAQTLSAQKIAETKFSQGIATRGSERADEGLQLRQDEFDAKQELLEAQPKFKNFDDLLLFEVGRGTYTLEEALELKKGGSGGTPKAPPDFASQFDKSFGKKVSAFEKNEASFIDDTQFSGDNVTSPYTSPNFDTDFDILRPTIDRRLGAGSADSVRNLLADKYNLGGQNTAITPQQETLGQGMFTDWGTLTPDEKIQVLKIKGLL